MSPRSEGKEFSAPGNRQGVKNSREQVWELPGMWKGHQYPRVLTLQLPHEAQQSNSILCSCLNFPPPPINVATKGLGLERFFGDEASKKGEKVSFNLALLPNPVSPGGEGRAGLQLLAFNSSKTPLKALNQL